MWSSKLNRKTVQDTRSLNGEAAVAVFRPRSANDQLAAVSSVQNAGDDDQYTLTSAHSTIADTVEQHHADTCMPELLS